MSGRGGPTTPFGRAEDHHGLRIGPSARLWTQISAMLSARGIRASYPDGEARMEVLRDVSLEAHGGVTAVLGPSGSGKSTLLRILAGLQAADGGTVTLNGTEFDCSRADDRAVATYVPQDFRLVPFLTVSDNIALACECRHVRTPDPAQALALVGLADMGHRRPHQLSGGQQQRVALARALAAGDSVLLVDEPTGSLDAATSRDVAAVLADVGSSGRVVLVATHDEAVMEIADRVLTLRGGLIGGAG